MAFILLEEVDRKGIVSEDLADLRKKGRRIDFAIRMNVDNSDFRFHCHGSGPFGPLCLVPVFAFRRAGLDDGARAVRAKDVLDPNGYSRDALLKGEIVDDFASVEGEFACFVGCEARKKAGGRNFARICSKDTVDFFPDLKLGCFKSYSDEGSTEIAVAAPEALNETAGNTTEEACDDGDLTSTSR